MGEVLEAMDDYVELEPTSPAPSLPMPRRFSCRKWWQHGPNSRWLEFEGAAAFGSFIVKECQPDGENAIFRSIDLLKCAGFTDLEFLPEPQGEVFRVRHNSSGTICECVQWADGKISVNWADGSVLSYSRATFEPYFTRIDGSEA